MRIMRIGLSVALGTVLCMTLYVALLWVEIRAGRDDRIGTFMSRDFVGAAIEGGPSDQQRERAASDDSDWLMQGRTFGNNRYLRRTPLTVANVSRLRRAWTLAIPDPFPIETSGISWHGTIFMTSAHDNVYAIDARTGKERWRFNYGNRVLAFAVNRGVALCGGRLYLGTTDGHLLSLDARTGHVIWNVVGVLNQKTSWYSMAPLVYDGKVMIGAANGDWGGRGYVSAFRASDGRRLWDFFTVPARGEPGNETWNGNSWRRGGAAVWGGLTLDAVSGTLYVDTGNPAPDFSGVNRRGSNLYSASMLAIDVRSSRPKMLWYNQFRRHDTHDWDIAMPPVLFTG